MVLKFRSCSQTQCGIYLKSICDFRPKLWSFTLAEKSSKFVSKSDLLLIFGEFNRILLVIMQSELWNEITKLSQVVSYNQNFHLKLVVPQEDINKNAELSA